jgi:UTP--glucose-1-phosphate uridylyltransferase
VRDQDEDYLKYGYVSGEVVEKGLIDIKTIVEKPGSRDKSPSNLASVSGYVFEPLLIDYLQKLKDSFSGKGEFIIQDAMQAMISEGHNIYGKEIQNGIFYDTGNPLEYLKTVFDFALARDDVGPPLSKHLRSKLGE